MSWTNKLQSFRVTDQPRSLVEWSKHSSSRFTEKYYIIAIVGIYYVFDSYNTGVICFLTINIWEISITVAFGIYRKEWKSIK